MNPLNDDWVEDGCTTTPEQRSWVREWVETLRGPLFLAGVTIHICHMAKACEDEPRTNADTTVSTDGYRQVILRLYPKLWDKDTPEAERRFFILHELVHVITARSRALAFDALNEKLVRAAEVKHANESETDWIAQIVWHLLPSSKLQTE